MCWKKNLWPVCRLSSMISFSFSFFKDIRRLLTVKVDAVKCMSGPGPAHFKPKPNMNLRPALSRLVSTLAVQYLLPFPRLTAVSYKHGPPGTIRIQVECVCLWSLYWFYRIRCRRDRTSHEMRRHEIQTAQTMSRLRKLMEEENQSFPNTADKPDKLFAFYFS